MRYLSDFDLLAVLNKKLSGVGDEEYFIASHLTVEWTS